MTLKNLAAILQPENTLKEGCALLGQAISARARQQSQAARNNELPNAAQQLAESPRDCLTGKLRAPFINVARSPQSPTSLARTCSMRCATNEKEETLHLETPQS
jgi:hypothetical protein